MEETKLAITGAEEVRQYVCFKLAGEEYGLDIHYVQEVVRCVDIFHVPQMPDCCLGVINIRGIVSALFDLRRVFKLADKKVEDATRILMVTVGNELVGFLVDEVLENITVPMVDIEPRPEVKLTVDCDCISGLVTLEERMIVLINVEQLHDGLERMVRAERMTL